MSNVPWMDSLIANAFAEHLDAQHVTSPVVEQAGPDDEVAQQVLNVAARVVALWREVHAHVSSDGCPNRAHLELLAWCERAEVDLTRLASDTTTRGAR